MPDQTERRYRVNELTPDPAVVFDTKIAEQYLRYARMLSARVPGLSLPAIVNNFSR